MAPAVFFGILSVIILSLFVLKYLPYDPPRDWSTFLGGPEEAIVASLIMILAIPWLISLVIFVRAIWSHVRQNRDENSN
ncbi:MAG: hypothetical protein ABSH08_22295 [Tepidisphaeraceae bacterium]|jgi:hypothetical protein